MSSEYAKTIMAWIETKKTTGTSETNEDNSEPVAFALGENQSTPSANYSEVKHSPFFRTAESGSDHSAFVPDGKFPQCF